MPSAKTKPAYKRIVLKLSGEAMRESGTRENISPQIVRAIAEAPTTAAAEELVAAACEVIGRLAS